MNNVLVTGASGFLGSHVVDDLMYHGFNVIGTCRGGEYRVNELAQLVRVELSNQQEVKNLFERFNPDYVVHCAGLASTPACIASPSDCERDNFTATRVLIDLAELYRVKRFVFASSNVVYGAATPYRRCKLASEFALHYSALNSCSLRFGNLYGEDQPYKGRNCNFIAAAVNAKRNGTPLPIFGDGSSKRDWLHVDDAARAVRLAVRSQCFYTDVVDICTGRAVTVREIAEALKLVVDWQPTREGDVTSLPQEAETAKRLLRFEAKTNLLGWLCDLS